MQTTAAIARDASVATARGPTRNGRKRRVRRVDALRTLKRLADENLHGGRAQADAVAARAVRIAAAMHLDAARRAGAPAREPSSQRWAPCCSVTSALQPSLPSAELGLDALAAALAERLLRACGFADAADIVASIDERYDGTGTPRGFSGNAIPVGARILAVARDVESTLEAARSTPVHWRPRARGSRRTRAARSTRTSSRSPSGRPSPSIRDGYR